MIHPLTKAFKELLVEHDYYARRRLACCRSCAGHLIPQEYESYCVYTVDYDERDLKKTGSCYLSWQAPEDNPKTIIKVLKKHGLKVKWDKNPRTRLFISVIKD